MYLTGHVRAVSSVGIGGIVVFIGCLGTRKITGSQKRVHCVVHCFSVGQN